MPRRVRRHRRHLDLAPHPAFAAARAYQHQHQLERIEPVRLRPPRAPIHLDSLQDKIAIVTGASQGIGRASALGLAQAGAHVVLAKHSEGRQEEIKTVQAEIESLGRRAPIVLVDVAKVDQVQSLIASAKDTFGRIDILVNNAGWTGTGPALDVTEDEYDKTMDASVKSVFFACQAAARVMIPQGRGTRLTPRRISPIPVRARGDRWCTADLAPA